MIGVRREVVITSGVRVAPKVTSGQRRPLYSLPGGTSETDCPATMNAPTATGSRLAA